MGPRLRGDDSNKCIVDDDSNKGRATRSLHSGIANGRCSGDAPECAAHEGGFRMWPDRRLLELFNIELPILLAPMAGAMDFELAAAVAQAGGLASLPCAMLDPAKAREQLEQFRKRSQAKINFGFFCHTPPELNNARE